jgi:hypothetical protein
MKKEKKKNSSLELEIIYAIVILYILICSALLAIHYLQPSDRETVTSSPSRSSTDSSDGRIMS